VAAEELNAPLLVKNPALARIVDEPRRNFRRLTLSHLWLSSAVRLRGNGLASERRWRVTGESSVVLRGNV
jgi:hypothetical protein